MEGVERVRDILQSIDMKRKRKPLTIIFVKGERCEKRKSACLDIVDCINRRRFDTLEYDEVWGGVTDITDVAVIDDIDKPFKYVSIELLEGHYIDDLSLNALKIFLE